MISYISFLCFTHFFCGLSAEAGGKSELGVCRNGDSRFAQENRRLQHEISALDGKVLHVVFCGRFCASTIRSKWVDEWIVDDLWSCNTLSVFQHVLPLEQGLRLSNMRYNCFACLSKAAGHCRTVATFHSRYGQSWRFVKIRFLLALQVKTPNNFSKNVLAFR